MKLFHSVKHLFFEKNIFNDTKNHMPTNQNYLLDIECFERDLLRFEAIRDANIGVCTETAYAAHIESKRIKTQLKQLKKRQYKYWEVY